MTCLLFICRLAKGLVHEPSHSFGSSFFAAMAKAIRQASRSDKSFMAVVMERYRDGLCGSVGGCGYGGSVVFFCVEARRTGTSS